ncbi:MAG: ADP-ribosylglycohydrolase family protein [Planctomycetes bacterium]|nr:ADP-ribosylglycohydrolase family protein [Planctomycetota bacterium]
MESQAPFSAWRSATLWACLARVSHGGAPAASSVNLQSGIAFFSAEGLADSLGLRKGITGYIYHTVPAVLYCWLRYPGDFRRAVEEIIDLSGDSDTTAALVGALVGATSGIGGIPADWLDRIVEWPRSVGWMKRIAKRLAAHSESNSPGPQGIFWPGLALRNLVFLAVVLVHGFRRLLPPY